MIDYAKDLDKLTATSKPPTPDERLREAVGDLIKLVESGDTLNDTATEAFKRLRSVYNEDPRPCINAAVEVEPRGLLTAYLKFRDRWYCWLISGAVLGYALRGILR